METFINAIVKEDSVSFSIKPATNFDYTNEGNVIKYLQRILFKPEVLNELKTLLTSISLDESISIKNVTIKIFINQLRQTLSNDFDDSQKIYIFRCVFLAFISSCKKDEHSVVILQFFIFLCHLAGVDKFLSFDLDNEREGLAYVNEHTFRNAFDVKISKSSLSLKILNDLLKCLSEEGINITLPEFDFYYKWLLHLIKNLATLKKYQSICLEIFATCVDLELKLIETNFHYIFSNLLLKKNCDDLYNIFLEKTINTSFKFQRLVKFITKLLIVIKTSCTNLSCEEIIPLSFLNEFLKILPLISSQQSLSLMELLVQNIQESCHGISKNEDETSLILFQVTSRIFIFFTKEVHIYAPNVSFNTLKSLSNHLIHLKEVLKLFQPFLLNKSKFFTKNKDIVKIFLELCFYSTEMDCLIYCYKDTFSENYLSADDNFKKDITSWQGEEFVDVYFNKKFSKCFSNFLQVALQSIRISKLQKTFAPPADWILKIIFELFSADINEFDLLSHLNQQDMIILIEFLEPCQSRKLLNKFVQHFLNPEITNEVFTWFRDTNILENKTFVVSFFLELVKELNSILENCKSKSFMPIDCIDEFNNPNLEKVKSFADKVNELILQREKLLSKLKKKSTEMNRLQKLCYLFKVLPLVHMENDFRKLGLSFAVILAVLCSKDDSTLPILLENVSNYLYSFVKADQCFDICSLIKWVTELPPSMKDHKTKLIEGLVKNLTNSEVGQPVWRMIDAVDVPESVTSYKNLDSQITIYLELGKCWFRQRKRKADNDIIGSCRSKLAKIIGESAKDLMGDPLSLDNYEFLFKVFAIQLQKYDQENVQELLNLRFLPYFNFAVEILNEKFDYASSLLLYVLLQSIPKIREFLPEGVIFQIWLALKNYGKANWKMFASVSTDIEFDKILADLLLTTEKFLKSELEHQCNYFDIWISFLEVESESKRKACQSSLQKLFSFISDCSNLLNNLTVSVKIWMTNFFNQCASSSKVILTSQMLDTIYEVSLSCSYKHSWSNENYELLFVAQINLASVIFLKQFVWNKSRLHLTFIFFQKIMKSLVERSNMVSNLNVEELRIFSTCAFSLEKWVRILTKKVTDFSRIAPYFIAAIISCLASVTVLPAIKIHLVNCLNLFLNISDPHIISYLLRVLKPGHQEVFNNMYGLFKKYYKYSGKV